MFAVGSKDVSQAEKEIIVCQAEQIHKMTSIRTQNGLGLSFCEFAQIASSSFFLSMK